MHKTQNIKQNKKNKQYIKPTTRSPESVLLCFIFPARRFIGGNIQRYVTMASSAVAGLMLARETQRIEAQGTHEVFLAKLLELSEANIEIKNTHIFGFYKTVSSKGNQSQQKRVASRVPRMWPLLRGGWLDTAREALCELRARACQREAALQEDHD